MLSDWFNSIQSWGADHVLVALTALLVVFCWSVPVYRNLALIHFVMMSLGQEWISAMQPLQDGSYTPYLIAISIECFTGLAILLLISINLDYLCQASIRLMLIYGALGLLNFAYFFDQTIFLNPGHESFFALSYSVMVPGLHMLTWLVLALPMAEHLINRYRSTHRPPA